MVRRAFVIALLLATAACQRRGGLGLTKVAGGGTAVRPVVSERVVRGLNGVEAEAAFPRMDPPDPLTEREVEVLRLMTGGYSNREIAGALRVAEGTVKNHVSNILSKLGVRDRTRAVLKAFELKLV